MNHLFVSKNIKTNQLDIHKKLIHTVEKHLQSKYKKPLQPFNVEAFNRFYTTFKRSQYKHFILDSCCGTGESSRRLAKKYPDLLIVGLDKSKCRIQKGSNAFNQLYPNLLIIRCDVIDFWQLLVSKSLVGKSLVDQSLIPLKHFILYPNPWPKPEHLKRRWHGHAVFPTLIRLSTSLEIRSNWKLYLEEFLYSIKQVNAFSLKHNLDIEAPCQTIKLKAIGNEQPITPFERKYQYSGHKLYALTYGDSPISF